MNDRLKSYIEAQLKVLDLTIISLLRDKPQKPSTEFEGLTNLKDFVEIINLYFVPAGKIFMDGLGDYKGVSEVEIKEAVAEYKREFNAKLFEFGDKFLSENSLD